MIKYNKGDRVKINSNAITIYGTTHMGYGGYEAMVEDWFAEGSYDIKVIKLGNIINHVPEYYLDLVKAKSDTMVGKIMDIKEKFVLALTSEPQRSFRKAGITNGDDILTDDGQKVFLSWLLHKVYAVKFKAEVVSVLLKKEKNEEKE